MHSRCISTTYSDGTGSRWIDVCSWHFLSNHYENVCAFSFVARRYGSHGACMLCKIHFETKQIRQTPWTRTKRKINSRKRNDTQNTIERCVVLRWQSFAFSSENGKERERELQQHQQANTSSLCVKYSRPLNLHFILCVCVCACAR